ncbi:MAG TPA: nucleotidyl transferase AbiEii/AbiGii toxin family protein [Acidimicrobiia bacterium]
MITEQEVAQRAQRFGVATVQIQRDHFISHVLAALPHDSRFSGGTALCRTYLEGTRLSEDIDLLGPDPSTSLAELEAALPAALRREFPNSAWTERGSVDDGVAATFAPPGIVAIKVYVGQLHPVDPWEFAATDVQLRYSDLPPTTSLLCPTLATFAAMKLSAWFDRHAPRDLYDLAGLAATGILADPVVADLFRAKHAVGLPVWEFARVPKSTATAWETELAGQVGVLPSAEECRATVGRAVAPPKESTPGDAPKVEE